MPKTESGRREGRAHKIQDKHNRGQKTPSPVCHGYRKQTPTDETYQVLYYFSMFQRNWNKGTAKQTNTGWVSGALRYPIRALPLTSPNNVFFVGGGHGFF